MRWRDSILLIGAALALAGGEMRAQETPAGVAPAADGPSEAAETADTAEPAKKEKTQQVEVGQTDLGGLDKLLPIGKTARKVTLPAVDAQNRLSSVTTIAKITRLDQENFLLDKVDITSLDHDHPDPATGQPEKTEMKIASGTYNHSTKILASDRPFSIRWPTMHLAGQTLIYDSLAGHALIKGHSQLLIAPPRPPAGAASPSPAEPAPSPGDSTPTDPQPQ